MSKKKTTVRYCKCGEPLPADEPKAKLCQACRSMERRGSCRMPGQHMTLREVVRAADAMGMSYGKFVSLGLDKVR